MDMIINKTTLKIKRYGLLPFSILIIFLMGLATGCQREPVVEVELPYTEEVYNLEFVNGKLHGTLTLPLEGEDFPVALIIAGSGPTDRDGNNPSSGKNNSLKMIAEELSKEGIASFRYDKRGIGESSSLAKKEEDLIFEDYIADAVSWVGKLREDPRFKEIIVIGHSEGALIGAAAVNNVDVDGFISLSGMGHSASDTLLRQIREQSEDVYELCLPMVGELLDGNLVPDIPEGLYVLFRPSIQPYLISWFKYNPVAEIESINCPLLILQGDRDLQITVEDGELLHKGIQIYPLAASL